MESPRDWNFEWQWLEYQIARKRITLLRKKAKRFGHIIRKISGEDGYTNDEPYSTYDLIVPPAPDSPKKYVLNGASLDELEQWVKQKEHEYWNVRREAEQKAQVGS